MQNKNHRISVKNYETGQQIDLVVNPNITNEDILEISESIANQDNKTSGQINDLVIYSQNLSRIVSQGETISDILKNIKLDELVIINRNSLSQSSLQLISVRIKFSYNNKIYLDRSYQFSRFIQLSQIGDEILNQINKTRDQCELLFEIKGRRYQPFKVNLTLAEIHMINQDEILVTIPTKLNIKICDGQKEYKIYILANKLDTIQDIENIVYENISLDKQLVKLQFEINKQILSSTRYSKSLLDLNINESTATSVKLLYSGGFQTKGIQC